MLIIKEMLKNVKYKYIVQISYSYSPDFDKRALSWFCIFKKSSTRLKVIKNIHNSNWWGSDRKTHVYLNEFIKDAASMYDGWYHITTLLFGYDTQEEMMANHPDLFFG